MKNSKMKKIFAGISGLCVMASALPAFPAVNAATESADFVAGDANCSGQVDIADAVAIMAYVTNSTAAPLSGQALDNADVYQRGDGVGITDAVSVQKYLTKLISSLPESYNEVIEPVTSVNYIHLKNTAIETEGENMVVEGTKVTISASGEYYVDGTLDDGQIIVNVPDETVDAETVKIFLNGVSITGTAAPAIYVENAENTSINLMDGTTNTLSDGTVAYSGDYLDTGVIEAKDDLTIKGTGTLNITANTQYAIQCNNDIKFTDGIVNIETILDDAVRGKTSVTVKELAVLNIDSECDGIKSTQGNVAIEGGTISVKAGNDAIQAETTIDISGGTVVAGGDRGLTGVTGVNITGGSVIATATDNQTDTTLLNATQGTMLLNCIADATNTEDGCWKKANTIVVNGSTTFAPVKKYMYVLISDASITNGSTYNLTNGSTGAVVTHNNELDNVFTTTGAVTTFETVNMNSTGGEVVTPADGYTITLGNTVSTNAPETVATVANNVVTIIQPAVFSVSGTASEGQIVVDVDKTAYADGVVELDLMGANLTSTTSSPIYVAQIGDEVQIVAKSGYDNVISDGSSYTNADGGMGAIYSCDDLKIKGSGNLTVNGNAGDGIVSKNDLKVYNGNITVNAVDDCIRGKDSVTVGDVDDTDFSTLILNLKSTAGDGIKSNCQDASTADKTYGVVDINGGIINMNVYGDGVQAAQILNVNGGTLDIETTGSKDSGSAKGLKGGLTDDTTGTTTTGIVNVNGGDIVLKTNDDGINSNGDINMLGGETQITVKGTTSGYQGLHADTTVNLGSDGKSNVYDDMRLVIYQAYEGIEAYNIYQKSGSTVVTSTDDAYNVAGGADNSGSSGGWPGQGGMGGSSSAGVLQISGGFSIISVANGDHDGYDSNGSLSISGGICITNGQDAFDCDGGMSYTGGVYIKNIGSQMGGMGGMGGGSSMTESVNVSCSLSGGERVTLCDGSGNVIVSFINDKSASSLVAGCTAYSGATFYTGGTLNGSTYFQELDQSQLAAYGGTLSGGTAVSGSGSGSTNPWG